MGFPTGRRRLHSALAIALVGCALTGCSFAKGGGAEQDCSTVKDAMTQARKDVQTASQKVATAGTSGMQVAATEMRAAAEKLRKSGEGLKDQELKSAVDAAAGDLEKMFGGGGTSSGTGLSKLDQAVQKKCSTG